jgi:Protein of unknown function (DUF4238)
MPRMGTSTQPVKKPHQHHVWQEYLQSWADADGAVFCLQSGRVFSTGTAVLGVGKEFYKVEALTDVDIALVKLLGPTEKQHPAVRKTVETFLGYVLMPTMLERQFSGALKDDGFSEWLDTYYTNVVDDQHTILERSFLPLLTQSLCEDISWYQNGVNRIAFYTYIAAQNLRTRRVKSRIIARLRERMGLDFSRIWNTLAVVYAFNSGSSMFGDPELRLTLVRNQTPVPFVTGDQPVINLDADGETGPELLSFFYPLSPHLALYLSQSGSTEVPAFIDTADKAMELNLRIASTSHSQIYAANAEVLEDLKERLESAVRATA